MNMPDSLFEWLLATTLRASVLAGVIYSVQMILRRQLPASWRYALWLPMLLVLLLPVVPVVPFRLFPRVSAGNPPLAEPAGSTAANAAPVSLPNEEHRSATGTEGYSRPTVLAILWIIGAGAVLGVGVTGYRRNMRRIMKDAVIPGVDILAWLERATREAGLTRSPRVILSPGVESPAVTGFIRPLLLLPAGFPSGFSGSETRMILLHELTHLKRRDLPVNWLVFVLQAAHWFNPILWFAFARVRADREAACDAQVLSIDAADRRSDYGNALLKLQCAAPSRPLSLGFVGIFERSPGLRSRIREISAHRKSHPAWRPAGVMLIGLLTLFGATRAEEPRKQQVARAVEIEDMDPRRAAIERKLDAIIVPLVKFEDSPVEEVIDFVRLRSVELDAIEKDPTKKGVNFVIRKPRGAGGNNAIDPGVIRLTLSLKDATLREVLAEIANQGGLEFKVDEFAITFVPAAEPDEPVAVIPPKPKEPSGKAVDAAAKIIIPAVDFGDVSLKEAVDFLNAKAKELAKGRPVPPIVLKANSKPASRIKQLHLKDVPLHIAVRYCAQESQHMWSADDQAIHIGKW